MWLSLVGAARKSTGASPASAPAAISGYADSWQCDKKIFSEQGLQMVISTLFNALHARNCPQFASGDSCRVFARLDA